MADLFGYDKPNSIQSEFDESFWPAYPRKVKKPVAFTAFEKARKKYSLAAILDLLATRKIEWRTRGNICYTPHAQSFLNGEEFPEPETVPIRETHQSWNGTQAILERYLKPGEFSAWFGPQEFIAGPPEIICATPFQAHEIERKYRFLLSRTFQSEVKIGVKLS